MYIRIAHCESDGVFDVWCMNRMVVMYLERITRNGCYVPSPCDYDRAISIWSPTRYTFHAMG